MHGTIKRQAAWFLAAALGLGAAADWAAAADKVEMSKVPHAARKEIEQATKGAHQVAVYDLGDEGYNKPVFMAHYTDPAGKRMEIKVGEDGKVLSHGETLSQRRKDAEARREGAKTAEEKAKVEQELAAQRDQEDRAAYDAWKASHAEQAPAHGPAATPSTPAVVGHPSLSLKDLSEEYNSTDRRPVPATALPPVVKKLFDQETIGTKNVDYYQYSANGHNFYSAHYDLGQEQRDVTRTDDSGQILGKNRLSGAATEADDTAAGHTGASHTPPAPHKK